VARADRETNAYQFDVHLNTGTTTITGQYATDYLAAEANQFINNGSTQPFYCVVTPTQPHAPFLPRTDLAETWLDFVWPIVDEVDVSDKPPWIQALAPLTRTARLGVDGAVVHRLYPAGEANLIEGCTLVEGSTETPNRVSHAGTLLRQPRLGEGEFATRCSGLAGPHAARAHRWRWARGSGS